MLKDATGGVNAREEGKLAVGRKGKVGWSDESDDWSSSSEAPLCTARWRWTRWADRCRIRTIPSPTASASRPSAGRTQRVYLISAHQHTIRGAEQGQICGASHRQRRSSTALAPHC